MNFERINSKFLLEENRENTYALPIARFSASLYAKN